jgi:hypothetical protein
LKMDFLWFLAFFEEGLFWCLIKVKIHWFLWSIVDSQCLVIDYASLALRFGIFSLFFTLNFLLLWSFCAYFWTPDKSCWIKTNCIDSIRFVGFVMTLCPLVNCYDWKVIVCSIMIMFYKWYIIPYLRLLEIQFRNEYYWKFNLEMIH